MRLRRDSKLASRGSWSNGGAFVWAVQGGAWRSGFVRKVEIEVKARDMVKSVGRLSVVLVVAGLVMAVALAGSAGASGCSNEAFRTGRSAALPDCRAYELVSPPELGRSADLAFLGANNGGSGPAISGEAFALDAVGAYFEPGADALGTSAVFSRSAGGWSMRSVVPAGFSPQDGLEPQLFSADLSQVAFASDDIITYESASLAFGPVGGPYTTVASLSGSRSEIGQTSFVGANAGTPAVPAYSAVVFASPNHDLLPPGPEREVAQEANPEQLDLYEFQDGRLTLVNVDSEGRLPSRCGARLGATVDREGSAVDAISADGSRVFFTSPGLRQRPGCLEPQLYMRVDGRETVDVSEPQGVSVAESERSAVLFDGASADGSRVFFASATALTPEAGSGPYLYEYDTTAAAGHRLKLIGHGVEAARSKINPGLVVAPDGGAVYFAGTCALKGGGEVSGAICRYDTASERTTFIAVPHTTTFAGEPWSVSADGRFFLFPSGGGVPVTVDGPGGLEPELRGAGHNELYRYSALDGSVACVSCGSGVAPARGEVRVMSPGFGWFPFDDRPVAGPALSSDGGRVFFQTGARLVSQDTNESTPEEELNDSSDEGLGNGEDVYEWEAFGTEETPGVSCRVVVGCTHLISTGEGGVGPERFLGASEDGRDVFLSSAALLTPGATPEFSNIYDARIGGGFPAAAPVVECATGCQGVGAPPPPSLGAPASVTFAGAGNPPDAEPPAGVGGKAPVKKRAGCRRGYRVAHGRCVRARSRRGRADRVRGRVGRVHRVGVGG